MSDYERAKTWMRPLRRFLHASGRDARRALTTPSLLRPTPLWHRRLGAVLVVLALVQGIRLMDRSIASGGVAGSEQAGIGHLEAAEWKAWSQRMGLAGASAQSAEPYLLDARVDAETASFADQRPMDQPESGTAGLRPDWTSRDALGRNARPHRFVEIQVTGYSSRICETDSTPTITAAGTMTEIGTIALSRDLLRTFHADAPFDFGDKVLIPGLGVFEVWDTMHPRWTYKADIWFDSTERALRFGRRAVFITRVEESAPTLAQHLP